MISQEKIVEAARVLHETAKPAKVILFGSYARGEAMERRLVFNCDLLGVKRRQGVI